MCIRDSHQYILLLTGAQRLFYRPACKQRCLLSGIGQRKAVIGPAEKAFDHIRTISHRQNGTADALVD